MREKRFSDLPIGSYFNPYDQWGMLNRPLMKVSPTQAAYIKPGDQAFVGDVPANARAMPIQVRLVVS